MKDSQPQTYKEMLALVEASRTPDEIEKVLASLEETTQRGISTTERMSGRNSQNADLTPVRRSA